MKGRRLALTVAVAGWLAGAFVVAAPRAAVTERPSVHPPVDLFQTSNSCLACHNGLTSASGEDISIGAEWRGSIMANSARDPYWQAAVRREAADHPTAIEAIQDECSICHMPMARTQAVAE